MTARRAETGAGPVRSNAPGPREALTGKGTRLKLASTGPGNLIAQLAGTSFTDGSPPPSWCELAAVDLHGNLSPFATVLPAGTTAVGDAAPRALAFAPASGNPVRGAAALRLEPPAASGVRVAICDAAGREVRTVADGVRPAGTWTIGWDGTGADGRAAASGLHFARLRVPGHDLVRRLVIAR